MNAIHAFDADVQTANLWIKSINARLAIDDPHVARCALRAVLHTLRDRIGPLNAAHLAAQLPLIVRGVFFKGWRPEMQTLERHRAAFMDRVVANFGAGPKPLPDLAVHAVLHTLWNYIDPGEAAKIKRLLPEEIAVLWSTGPDAVDFAAPHHAQRG